MYVYYTCHIFCFKSSCELSCMDSFFVSLQILIKKKKKMSTKVYWNRAACTTSPGPWPPTDCHGRERLTFDAYVTLTFCDCFQIAVRWIPGESEILSNSDKLTFNLRFDFLVLTFCHCHVSIIIYNSHGMVCDY